MTRIGCCFGLLLVASAAGGADWPQFGLDARHGANNRGEIAIHAGNVATLHVRYHVALPAIADGAGALLTGVATPSGVKDVLFLTTKDGRILALDAATGATLWSKQPATGPRYTTSSPAVDPNRLYVYSYGLEGGVHKYQVGDGTEVTTGGWPEVATLKPSVEKGSSALTVAQTPDGDFLYVANGGYPGDAGDYQGHVTTIRLADGAQTVFNAACSDQTVHFVQAPGTPDCSEVQTAIWARPGVVYDADNDRIFMSTGNGTYDGNAGGHHWGDTVFALHPDGTGASGNPVDTYTPTEFQSLDDTDLDLGSTAPAILGAPPGSNVAHLALQSGKDAKLRLLDADNLSRAGGPGHLGGELQKVAVPQGGQVLTQPAVWVDPSDGSTWTFVANGSGISGLQVVVDGAGNPSLATRWTKSGGGSSPIVANGLLFYAGSGGIKALSPTTGTQLWSDNSLGGIHWESPIAVNGRLYITDESSQLWVYEPTAVALEFYTVAPCRVADTRGGSRLASGATRLFAIAGQCGIPADALAVVANVTAVQPSAPGSVAVGPSGVDLVDRAIAFKAGSVRANNVVVALTGNPVGVAAVQSGLAGSVDIVIDVAGYFK